MFFKNHYTHEIIIVKILGDCSYSFQGSVEFIALQLQFPCSFCRMQLQKIIPSEFFLFKNSLEHTSVALYTIVFLGSLATIILAID